MKLRREKSFLVWAAVWALAVFAPACGSDGNGDGSQALCVVEELEAGAYSFTRQTVVDDCSGVDVGDLIRIIDPGPYGPIALPSFAELQAGTDPVDIELPVIGTVEVQLSLDGDVVRLTLPGGAVDVLVLPGCTATIGARGTLCPVSMSQVNATLVITIEDVVGDCDLIPVDCSATINLRGVQQGG